ncbi:hypothetical protein EDD11_010569 [Mortierella claussenii]|nr:hypothetical protein EDD11_010569 [Mortierella claussenii]
MPSDTPAQDGAPAPKVDFTAAMAKVKALAAKLGNSASNAAPPAVAASGAPAPMKRPYEEDSYSHGHDSHGDDYGKRMAYDSGRDSGPVHRPGLGAQISHYAPPMRNEHSIQEEMGVPGNLVGLIIGRGGENLKRIERDTGCRVQFSQDGNPGDRERFVNIIGQPAGIEDAKRQIQEIITSSQTGERLGGGSYGGGGYGSGSYGMGGGGGGGGSGGYGRAGSSATIQIPSAKVGLVIGRGGETIRDLQDRSGARIAVTPSPHDHSSPSRTVTITGDDGAIERAKAFIEEIVSDMAPRGGGYGGGGFQSTPPVTMTVPQESIGLVIGRGGETVKQLQIQSRAKIQVQQVDPGMPPPAERTINLFGPPEAVEYAKQLIMEKVAGARDNDRYGGQRDQGGYGASGGYGSGYQQQQQQYQQPQSTSSAGYGQLGGYGAPAASAAAATTGYTPEQQAAYAQYYGYQYPGTGYQAPAATATSDASSTTAVSGADTSSYAYDYSRYASGQYGTTIATSAAPAALSTPDVSTGAAASTIVAATPATTDASSATAGATAPDYSAYFTQQGYSQEAIQQYYSQYSQYYGYGTGSATAASAEGTSLAPTATAVEVAPSGATVLAPASTSIGMTAAGSTDPSAAASAPASSTDAIATSSTVENK